jgi:hypothetical protein
VSDAHPRLQLDSPKWDEPEFSRDRDLCALWEKIYSKPSEQRGKLLLQLIDQTEYVNHPTIAFHFASPYLIDNFASNFIHNWIAFPAYCETLHYAFNGPIGPWLHQIWNDRIRICELMVRGLDHLEQLQPHHDKHGYYFRLFISCIPTAFGDEVLGYHVMTDPD